MAAGKFTVLNRAMPRLLNGSIVPGADVFKVCLCTADEGLTPEWTGGSGDALYSDLSHEASGTGYTEGGEDVPDVVLSPDGARVTVSAGSVVWSDATLTAKYAVIYKASTGEVMGFADLETTDPSGRTVTATDLTLLFPDGLFDLERQD